LEAEKLQIADSFEQERRASREEAKRQTKKFEFLTQANKSKNDKIRQLQEASRIHREKCDVLQHRSEELEDIVKKAESLLITLDHSFNELISMSTVHSDMHPHFRPLSKEKMEEISDRKKKHQECLVKLRSDYEDQNKQLEALEGEIEQPETANLISEGRGEQQEEREKEDLQDSLEEDSDRD